MHPITKRLFEVLDLLGLSNYQVSKQSGITEAALSYWRSDTEGKRKPKLEIFEWLLQNFEVVNIEYILKGVGEPIKKKPRTVANKLVSMVPSPPPGTAVPILDVRAAASSRLGSLSPDFPEQLGTIQVPSVMLKSGRAYSCIEVTNDSMSPTLYQKDYIVIMDIHPAEWVHKVRDSHIYVIVGKDDSINVKRLKNRLLDQQIIVCRSDNRAHSSYVMRGDEISAIYEVCFKISFNLRDENANLFSIVSDLQDRVDILERQRLKNN